MLTIYTQKCGDRTSALIFDRKSAAFIFQPSTASNKSVPRQRLDDLYFAGLPNSDDGVTCTIALVGLTLFGWGMAECADEGVIVFKLFLTTFPIVVYIGAQLVGTICIVYLFTPSPHWLP